MTDRPTVYYDGACPICSREIAHYRTRQGADAVAWVDVATCAPAALGQDLARERALDRMHVRLGDGRLVSGAAAFAALWRTLPGFRWLGRLVGAPGVRHVAEGAYRAFQYSRRLGRFRRTQAPSQATSAD
jgi:predicted DCC family thiol-disulfide oxidoreductase YuxK